MNLQLFPNSCGFNVAESWCPITDLHLWLLWILVAIMIYLIWQFIKHTRTIFMRKR